MLGLRGAARLIGLLVRLLLRASRFAVFLGLALAFLLVPLDFATTDVEQLRWTQIPGFVAAEYGEATTAR